MCYERIRYESTIAGQFFGHSHSDSLQVYYDETDTSRPVRLASVSETHSQCTTVHTLCTCSFAMVGPSVTPFSDLNLGYRIYTIDGDHDKTTNVIKPNLQLTVISSFTHSILGHA